MASISIDFVVEAVVGMHVGLGLRSDSLNSHIDIAMHAGHQTCTPAVVVT